MVLLLLGGFALANLFMLIRIWLKGRARRVALRARIETLVPGRRASWRPRR